MPLTDKGKKIMRSMKKSYSSPKKAEEVFYASKNAGTISGVDRSGHSHSPFAENMKSGGPDESKVSDQNAPFRDLNKSGHHLNHTYKTPPAAISPDVIKAGTNHSYLHPHSHAGMRDATKFPNANRIKPMNQMGTGKT